MQSPSWFRKDQWHHRRIGHKLGKGSFGEVHKTLNLHTGDYYAVKTLQQPTAHTTEEVWKNAVLREVEILSVLCHVSCSLTALEVPFLDENEQVKDQ